MKAHRLLTILALGRSHRSPSAVLERSATGAKVAQTAEAWEVSVKADATSQEGRELWLQRKPRSAPGTHQPQLRLPRLLVRARS